MKQLNKVLCLLPLAIAGQAHATSCSWNGDCDGNAASVSPGSSLSATVLNDFDVAMAAEGAADEAGGVAAAGPVPGRAGVGVECSWFSDRLNGDTKLCTIPLSYTIHNEIDPRRQLTLKLPISRVVNDKTGADLATYHVGFGASYTYPLAARWYVTPSVNYTYADEGDFSNYLGGNAGKANLLSASIASTYYYKDRGLDVGIGNMFLSSRTVDETGLHTRMHSNVLRNGMMFGWPGQLAGKKVFWEGSIVDTLFFGSQTYTDHQLEVGITVGNKRSYKVTTGGYRLGLTLFEAGSASGVKFAWGYWF